jgi:DNA-binding response OmpR family regulator
MTLIRLLLVEDNPAEARLVQLLMGEAALPALEVAVAQTLEQAAVMLELGDFQAVLLDLGLPDSQGLDTFTHLHQRFPEVPILILTGSTDEALGTAAVQGGAQDYLVKDQLEARTLSRSLRYAMERHRLLKELERSATVIRDLQRLLPICASCKKIRDEEGIWEPLEHYLTRVSHMGITHGICPECSRRVLEGG